MKKRLKKKLEKEDIFIKNFASEYKKLKKTKEENIYAQKVINNLRCHISEITPNEVIISKAMFFALVGYLPKNIASLAKIQERDLPIKLGGFFVQVGKGIVDEQGRQTDVQNLKEELYILEINKDKGYIIILYKGLGIKIKIPIIMKYTKCEINGVKTETTCWNYDFIHAGIRVISDDDFSTLIVFYKTALEVSYLIGGSESLNRKIEY